MRTEQKKTVSLVLGSGGARGLAHIGIIEWLTGHGYEIASISGASMGSLVGGIHAAGELDAYKHWVCALRRGDVLRFLDFAFSGDGLLKGDRIMDTLREMVGDRAIETLPISYTAVATDIDRQREVWITQGPLFDAVRASIAVPGVFTPYEYLGMTLVDGGLLNPVPIAPTFRDFTDLTIAVNLNAQDPRPLRPEPPAPEIDQDSAGDRGYQARIRQFLDAIGDNFTSAGSQRLGVFELTLRSFETMQNAIAATKLAAYRPDVLIDVPRDACAAHEFNRAREIIELGYRLAESAMGSDPSRT
ncbi:patatin-like phospholipase family protein [Thiocystis violacea]|uniref:patatin-like phospholipase family protein n=1 Tax=Thiocystis violacea TaxID=13725 RepID=UPI0019068D96|nr:patatin-like phospholipase family protein [Thiocystis violacea]MBK1716678.1 serine protease [Thiocystis violacea]